MQRALAVLALGACGGGNAAPNVPPDSAVGDASIVDAAELAVDSGTTRSPLPPGCCFIVTGDQSSGGRIRVFDPGVVDWNSAAAVKWTWAPSASNGFSNPTAGWGLPAGMRLRDIPLYGGPVVGVADGRGFAAIIPYPAGATKRWAIRLPNTANLHGVEVLPNGNVALAASSGNWIRVYAASQGVYNTTFAEAALPDAHNVLWDPERNWLWAIGADSLNAYTVGSAASPKLTLVHSYDIVAAGAARYGHDLQPDYGDTNRLLFSTNGGVYRFDKTTGAATPLGGGTNRVGIKAIGFNSNLDQFLETQPKAGTCFAWTTTTVDFFGATNTTRTRSDACFYRAAYWTDVYQ